MCAEICYEHFPSLIIYRGFFVFGVDFQEIFSPKRKIRRFAYFSSFGFVQDDVFFQHSFCLVQSVPYSFKGYAVLAGEKHQTDLFLTIKIVLDKSIALRILKEERLVTSISLSGDEMRIDFKGSREDETALLKRMIDSGVRVSGFMRERGDLETVFLQLAGKQEERAVMEYEMESGILEGDYR